jgi:hypothetical protein
MANALVGFNPTDTFTLAQSTQGKIFGLGDRISQHDGKEFVFLQASSAVAANDVVVWTAGVFTAAALTTANGLRGLNLGVAPALVNSGEYFWAQVKGNISTNVLALCVANVRLNTTATAGKIDDDGTATTKQVQGIYITATNGASTAAVNAILNDPVIDATL